MIVRMGAIIRLIVLWIGACGFFVLGCWWAGSRRVNAQERAYASGFADGKVWEREHPT